MHSGSVAQAIRRIKIPEQNHRSTNLNVELMMWKVGDFNGIQVLCRVDILTSVINNPVCTLKRTGPEQKYSDDFEIPNATFTKQTPNLRDPENSRDVVLLSLLLNAKDS